LDTVSNPEESQVVRHPEMGVRSGVERASPRGGAGCGGRDSRVSAG
jgi:nitrogenase subunit NifH